MKDKVLVFSIALNGYQWLYKGCIESHKRYAKHHGYGYQVVTRPYATLLGVECCWLKLTLMQEALRHGYDTVLFVDADAYIQTSAPALTNALLPDKYLYLAKGYSGRYNSGVLLVRNHKEVRALLNSIIAGRYQQVSLESNVGWGENGHIIEHTDDCQFVSTLSRKWNNTYDLELEDYIRHFNYGPLRTKVWLNLCHKLLGRVTKLFRKLSMTFTSERTRASHDKLTQLTAVVLSRYPIFSQI